MSATLFELLTEPLKVLWAAGALFLSVKTGFLTLAEL